MSEGASRRVEWLRSTRAPLDFGLRPLDSLRSLEAPLDAPTQYGPATSEPAQRASRVVRKGGLEPPRYCYRQPLKLVDLLD